MYRRVPKQAAYDTYTQNTSDLGCPFCALDNPILNPRDRDIIEGSHTVIIDNLFAYDTWDGYKVTEHLMLLPKRHVVSIAELTQPERAEYIDILCDYEAKGYSIYSRAPSSGARSHIHVHTHLIKITGAIAHRIEYIKKPYNLTIEW